MVENNTNSNKIIHFNSPIVTVAELKLNDTVMEGSVHLPDWFLELGPLARADVLIDWIHKLNQYYDSAVNDFHEELEILRTELTE